MLLLYNNNLASKFNLTSKQVYDYLINEQYSNLPNIKHIKSVLHNKILELNVYYDDLSYTLIEEDKKMDLIDVMANVGGTLGLFLGVSFLSFFVEFFSFYLFYATNIVLNLNFKGIGRIDCRNLHLPLSKSFRSEIKIFQI